VTFIHGFARVAMLSGRGNMLSWGCSGLFSDFSGIPLARASPIDKVLKFIVGKTDQKIDVFLTL